MILVAVSTFGFERLITKMDEIAGRIDEEVVMQIGRTKYIPQHTKYFDFTTEEALRELCRRARVVVTHGAMIILDALEQDTPVIAVPRLKRYGEAIDDHQLYLVQELEKDGKVTAVYELDKLGEALQNPELKLPELLTDRELVKALASCVAQFK